MDLENVAKLKALTGLCQHEVENVDNPDLTLNLYETHYKQTMKNKEND